MKIKDITIGKEMKVGLPKFSNITANCAITFEIKEGEDVNWDEAWGTVNRQLSLQVDNIEPSWMETQEYGKFFKIIIKVPKGKDN